MYFFKFIMTFLGVNTNLGGWEAPERVLNPNPRQIEHLLFHVYVGLEINGGWGFDLFRTVVDPSEKCAKMGLGVGFSTIHS